MVEFNSSINPESYERFGLVMDRNKRHCQISWQVEKARKRRGCEIEKKRSRQREADLERKEDLA